MPKKEKLPKQAKHEKQQKKRKGRSVQDFIGVKTFTKYGLMTQKGELLFYLVSWTIKSLYESPTTFSTATGSTGFPVVYSSRIARYSDR